MIKIYTDGSCIGNPGKGGWAAIIITDKEKKIISGKQDTATNNQMELLAPIKALKEISIKSKIEIFTDSQYVKTGITEWIINWKKNGWRTANKKDVLNKDLWLTLDKETERHEVKWSWVKGHSQDTLNNEVDELAREAASK